MESLYKNTILRNYQVFENLILKKLDDMTGRVIDNCSFFELDDLDDISEEDLYENMLEEFPSWLKEAREIGLIAK